MGWQRGYCLVSADSCKVSSTLRKLYESEPVMIIVAIGWLYVVMMIAAVSDTLLIGVLRLLFLGVLPVGLLLWIKLKSFRARAEAAQEENSES